MELNNVFLRNCGLSVSLCVRLIAEADESQMAVRTLLLLIQSAVSWKDMFFVSRPASKDDMGIKLQLNSIKINK